LYEIKADGQLIYSTSVPDAEYQVIAPALRYEFNKPDKLTFTFPPEHAMRNAVHKLKSIITVEQDGEEIFKGRIVEETTDLYNQKLVSCEGELSFLYDSLQRPYEFDGTAKDYFKMLITNHNEQVGKDKQFTSGMITAVDDEDSFDAESIDYKDTFDEMRVMLLEAYGGYLRVRYEDGVRYLDYIDEYDETCAQKIEFGVNLLDIEDYIDAQDIFTVLVPTGSKDGKELLTIESVNDDLDYIESKEGIERYGRIVKHYRWDEVDDPVKLLELAQEKLLNAEAFNTITIKAIDLHLIDVEAERIRLGDTVHIVSSPHGIDREVLCSMVEIDLFNPENSRYTFGEKPETLTDNVAANKRRSDGNLNHIKQTQHAVNIYIEHTDEALQRLSTVEVDIDALNASISLSASRIDELNQRVTSAEINIDGANAEIELKVSKDGIISAINQTAESITISASKINLSGYVTASEFSAEIASIDRLLTGSAAISYLNVSAITIGGTYINSLAFHNVTIDGTRYTLLGAPN